MTSSRSPPGGLEESVGVQGEDGARRQLDLGGGVSPHPPARRAAAQAGRRGRRSALRMAQNRRGWAAEGVQAAGEAARIQLYQLALGLREGLRRRGPVEAWERMFSP
jgi:hypothetical protein